MGNTKYNKNKYYVKLIWTGTFYPNPKHPQKRTYEDEFEFDSFPKEDDIVTKFFECQPLIVNRDDWDDIKILSYTIINPMIDNEIIIKSTKEENMGTIVKLLENGEIRLRTGKLVKPVNEIVKIEDDVVHFKLNKNRTTGEYRYVGQVDLADYCRLSLWAHRLTVDHATKAGVIAYDNGYEHKSLAAAILNPEKGKKVKYSNSDKLDCRKCNLVVAGTVPVNTNYTETPETLHYEQPTLFDYLIDDLVDE